MVNKKIKQEIEELYTKKWMLLKNINEEIKIKRKKLEDTCDHKDESGKSTIKYNSPYEMRSDDMYCTQCGKQGTRKELLNQY